MIDFSEERTLIKPFQSISEASRTTGLSQKYLRQGCKAQKIPFIKAGTKFTINVPLLYEQLNRQSVLSGHEI